MALVKKEFGDLLVDHGLITDEELQKAQEERARTGEPLSMVLAKMGLVTENHVKTALELKYGVTYVALANNTPDDDILGMLPEGIMRKFQVAPIGKEGDRLLLAMVNPNNLVALDDIKYRLQGLHIKPMVCTEDDFQFFMETCYGKFMAKAGPGEHEEAQQAYLDQEVDLTSALSIINEQKQEFSEIEMAKQAADEPIVLLANQILAKAIKMHYSDIHIEPQEKQIVVRYRLDGVLFIDRKLPKAVLGPLISRFKIMSNLDIAERRIPQDGRMRLRFSGRDTDFRVSTLPVKHGEKVVMRLLDKSNTALQLDKLIADKESFAEIKDMISKPYGIIFVCGPTGSGKTTSLYAALAERNSREINILTVEDPIEYDMKGITQVQVLREKGVDFARVLRAFLRQDPDVMLVGETRDKETAKIAVEAALTGHLVFTTLHTNDAPSAITRLAEMSIDPYLVAAATIGVVAQRLVRRICSDCTEEYVPEKSVLEYLGLMEKHHEKLADATVNYYRLRTNDDGLPLFNRGKGCNSCQNTGYRGRAGVYEIMRLSDELRQLIASGANLSHIRFAAKQNGMVPLKDYSLRLVAQGITSVDEVIRVTMSDTTGADKLCPMCHNPIGDDFIKCPFCQHDLKETCVRCGTFQEESWDSCAQCGFSKTDAELETSCRTCQAEVDDSWEVCPYCQTAKKSEVAS